MNGSENTLAWDVGNQALCAGSSFSIAGGQPARVARIDARTSQEPPLTLTATPDIITLDQQSTLSVTGGTCTGAEACTVTATKAGHEEYRPSRDAVDVIVIPP